MNAYEHIGRERKAQAIARFLWLQIPRQDRTNQQLPAGIAAVDQEERDIFSAHAGQKSPSEATWARVVELIGEKIADERRWLSLDPSEPVGEQRSA